MAAHVVFGTGVVLICCALAADAVIGNVQEKVMRQHGTSNTEMVGTAVLDC